MNSNPQSTPQKISPDELFGESRGISPDELFGGGSEEKLSSESNQTTELEGGNNILLDPTQSPQTENISSSEDSGENEVDKVEKERNFFKSVGKTFWNVATKQIPAMMKAGVSAMPTNITSDPMGDRFLRSRESTAEGLGNIQEEARLQNEEARKKSFQSALEGMEDFQEAHQGLVTTTHDIDDSIDLLNYVGNSLAQAAAQIPASVASFGLTSIGQEVGITYMEQVKKIAEKEDITPEEVIEQGLDNKASAFAYGSFAGSLDALGARAVVKAVPLDKFRNDIARRGLGMLRAATQEGITEGSQSVIEQFGSSRGAGDSLFTALTGVDIREVGEEALAGAIGGGGLSSVNIIRESVKESKQKLSNNDMTAEERVEAERELAEDGAAIRTAGIDPLIGDNDISFVKDQLEVINNRVSEQKDQLNSTNKELNIAQKANQEVNNLVKRYSDEHKEQDDPHRRAARIATNHFSELSSDVQEYFAERAEGIDFESPGQQHYRGLREDTNDIEFRDRSGRITGSHIATLQSNVIPNLQQESISVEEQINQGEQEIRDIQKILPSSREEQTPSTIAVDPYERPGTFKGKFREWFLDRGNLPKNVFKRKLEKDQKVDSELQRMRFYVRDLNKAMDEVYQPKGRIASALSGEGLVKQDIPQEAYEQINQALRGEADFEVLPEQIQGPAKKIRTHVDRLSRKLIDAGVVEGKMGVVVDENMGVYMNRSYRLHDDPKWAEKVPSDIRNKAKAFIRDKYPDHNDRQIENMIDDILYSEDAPMAILSGGMEGSKDLSVLKQREDIAPEIRALMGEYTDPIVNYSKSVYKMANLLESHQFLSDVRDKGMGHIFFEENDPNRPQGFNAEIATEGSDVMSPLNGLRTAPEIKEAFEQSFRDSQPGRLAQGYLKANAAVKYGKTVGSVTTHIRNLMGGVGFAIANGHTPSAKHFIEATTRVKDSFTADNKSAQDRVIRLKELGVLADGATVGELRGYLKDANLKDPEATNDIFSNIERKSGVFGKGRKMVNTLTNLYQAEDNLLRTFMFESEVARYQKAMPEASTQEVEELAADIVSRTYQNYDRVPKVIQAIRKIPLVGTFASFPAEVIRTSYNTVQQAKTEMQSDKAEIRKIGRRRAAGILAATTLTSAAQQFTQAALSMSDEEDEDLRRFMPPWSKNSSLLYLDKGKGNVRYMNMSYTDPHEYLKDPIYSMLFGENAGSMDAAINSLKEFFDPFLGEEILVQRILDIRSNKKSPSGGQIYNPQDPLGDQVAGAMGYLWEAFEPGTLTQGKRLGLAFSGLTNEYGKKYNVKDEVLGFFGMRISEVDVAQSMQFKGYGYSNEIRDSRRIFNKVKNRQGRVPNEELRGAEVKANQALRGTWEEAKRDWDAAYRLGLSTNEIKSQLEKGNLPKWFIESVENDRFREFDFD